MLKIENLSKYYGKTKALDNINMELTNGVYGLLGPNGAGKSSLMNIITLGPDFDSGQVLWHGNPIEKCGVAYRSVLGFMPQQQGLYDGFSGLAFLCYIATLKDIPKRQIKDEVLRVAGLVNLTDRLKDRLSGYSGGMKQRILLAAAVLGAPALVILDEPTAGLDPKERIRTRELIKGMADGRIILVATHVVSDIESIADEIIMMKKGVIAYKDSPDRLCEEIGNGQGLEGAYMHVFAEPSDNTETELSV
jgi:ABC-type multidrug transport system ATPase subunit